VQVPADNSNKLHWLV